MGKSIRCKSRPNLKDVDRIVEGNAPRFSCREAFLLAYEGTLIGQSTAVVVIIIIGQYSLRPLNMTA
jgi:hypothetical protein